MSLALNFFKNSNGMLMIRHVFLEINIFKVDGGIRSLETLAELRHVKHVVHICKVGWKLNLIGEIASFASFRVWVLNILGLNRDLSSGLGTPPVDRLSSFVPFGVRLILQRLTGVP